VRPAHRSAEVQRLKPALARANAGFAANQAALWIVTDNATYADLGHLVTRVISGPGTGTQRRSIQESDAALAMKLVDEAGIDVSRKAIWRDRPAILGGVIDPAVKSWLEKRGQR
jgi:hypothetical protein